MSKAESRAGKNARRSRSSDGHGRGNEEGVWAAVIPPALVCSISGENRDGSLLKTKEGNPTRASGTRVLSEREERGAQAIVKQSESDGSLSL